MSEKGENIERKYKSRKNVDEDFEKLRRIVKNRKNKKKNK